MRGTSLEVRLFQMRTPVSLPWGRVQDEAGLFGRDEEKRRLEEVSSACRGPSVESCEHARDPQP
jgi:hypothetical protein